MGSFNVYADNISNMPSGWASRLVVYTGAVVPTVDNCYIVARNTSIVATYYTGTIIAGFFLDGDQTTDVQTGTHIGYGLDKDNAWSYDANYSDVQYYPAYDVTYITLSSGSVTSYSNTGDINDFYAVDGYLYEEPTANMGDWLQHARDYFDAQAAGATMDVRVYSIGDHQTKLYTWIWDNITNNDYPESDYTVRFGVSDVSTDDGLLAGELNYTDGQFEMSYTELYNSMASTQQAVAESAGVFYVNCLLCRYVDGVLVERCDNWVFGIHSDGTITDDGTSVTPPDIQEDTNPLTDDSYEGDGSSFETQAAGQAMSVDNLLTTSYAISEADLVAFGSWLWANNLQNLEELQTAPIENVLSCKRIPFDVTGTSTTVKLGNLTVSGVTGYKTTAGHVQDCGSVQVPTYHGGSFIDSANKISIYLPYCGVQSIPTSVCYEQLKDATTGIPYLSGRTIGVKYYYDIIYGTCCAAVTIDGTEFAYYNGTCGIDIPITASNRAQNELAIRKEGANAIVGSVGNLVTGAATGGLAGAALATLGIVQQVAKIELVDKKLQDTHYTTSGGFSSQVASFLSSSITLFIETPIYTHPKKYGHQNGKPCNLTLNLSELKGYTELEGNVDIDGIACLDEERELLLQALTEGFYL